MRILHNLSKNNIQFLSTSFLLLLFINQGVSMQIKSSDSYFINTGTAKSESLEAIIDPGAELITIMLWMSGKYAIPMDSQYKTDVWKHFSKYRNHPTLSRMKKAKLFNDFSEVGLFLSDFPNIKIEIPEECSWYKTTGKDEVIGILNDAKSFAKATSYWKFHRKHKAEYTNLTELFTKQVKEKKVLDVIENFFGYEDERASPKITIYLEPLNYWGAHAINFELLRGDSSDKRIAFQIGPSAQREQFPDSPIKFNLNVSTTKNIWHESSHVYLRKALDENKDDIAKLSKLFNSKDLASQNIKTWDYAFEENLIRSIVAIVAKQRIGDDEYDYEISNQTRRGFIYTKDIAEKILSGYVGKQTSYKTFDEFIPEVIALLKTKELSN